MEDNHQNNEDCLKINFFETIWYSLTKFEKYPEMAILGIKKALSYFSIMMLLVSLIFSGTYLYSINTGDEKLSTKIIQEVLNNGNFNEDEKGKILEEFSDNLDDNKIIIIFFLSVFIDLYCQTLLDVFVLSIIGLIICFLVKIKINLKALFNMSIYAYTLSIILELIYIPIAMFTDFKIRYFYIMYQTIPSIVLIAVICMIKSDIIKQQLQLIGILEKSKEKLEQNPNIPKEEKEREKEEEEEEENREKEEKPNDSEEEQGSNA